MTNDVDVIVGENPQSIREQLLKDERFSMTAGNQLQFKLSAQPEASSGMYITVEMLQGGADQALKLPDANSVSMLWINPSETDSNCVDCEVPVIHPFPLILTKIKRWMFIAESSRPASRTKAVNDLSDIKTLLRWIVDNKMTIDFSMYPEKAKEDLIPGIKLLLALGGAEISDMLQKALSPEDFEAIQ